MSKLKVVTFKIPDDEWEIFKLLLLKKTRILNEKTGVMEPVTPSWMLRDMIDTYIGEAEKAGHLSSLIKEIEKENPNAPILETLYEYVGETEQK